jgi:hypothetical protein
LSAEKPFFIFTQPRPHRSGNARKQEEKMERKLVVTLIGIGLIVLVLWLSSGCSAV